jgi:hypothetical protein
MIFTKREDAWFLDPPDSQLYNFESGPGKTAPSQMPLDKVVNKMTPKNLAICFAPNLIDASAISGANEISEYSDTSQEIIMKLIETSLRFLALASVY